MSPINKVLTRETLVERHNDTEHLADRSMPSEEFNVFLQPSETVATVGTEVLTERLAKAFEPYTDDGDDTHPRIAIVPFRVEAATDHKVSIHADFVSGPDVIHLRPFFGYRNKYDSEAEPPPIPTPPAEHAEAFRSLNTSLFHNSSDLADAPGALLWYEAIPSQFIYIPPGCEALVNNEPMAGGPAGTFLLVDLDARFVRVETGEISDDFVDRLTFQFHMLTVEAEKLFGFNLHDQEYQSNDVKHLVASETFQQRWVIGQQVLQAVLNSAA